MNPANDIADMTFRTMSGTDQDVEQLDDATTPEEMYGAVIGHRAPSPIVEQEPAGE